MVEEEETQNVNEIQERETHFF